MMMVKRFECASRDISGIRFFFMEHRTSEAKQSQPKVNGYLWQREKKNKLCA